MSGSGLKGMSVKGWIGLARWTVFGTLGCIAISNAFNYVYFSSVAPQALPESLVSATIIPVILAAPLFFYLTLKLRELAIANHRLRTLASTDSLTECLNRGAFTTHVQNELHAPKTPGGALLVIDADHFKTINDRHGHHTGDEALRSIAASIRACLRKNDVCGRLGGEEFGVFLPRTTAVEAAAVAERIRQTVRSADFAPDGAEALLSVSVGGVACEGAASFEDLFRVADDRLYAAKKTGRDKVEFSFAVLPGAAGLSAATLH